MFILTTKIENIVTQSSHSDITHVRAWPSPHKVNCFIATVSKHIAATCMRRLLDLYVQDKKERRSSVLFYHV